MAAPKPTCKTVFPTSDPAWDEALGMKDFGVNGRKKIMSNCCGCANLSLQMTAWDTAR